MSKMGNLVLAMQEELEIIMDPTFVFQGRLNPIRT